MTNLPGRNGAGDNGQRSVMVALDAVQNACRARGLQFTTIRRAVLEDLLDAGQPVGAYDLLRRLERRLSRPISPPTVYRALEFLIDQGFVARLAAKHAFVPCVHPDHPGVFFICEKCGISVEVENSGAEALFEKDAVALGFRIGKRIVEMQGICAECLAAESAAH